MEERAAPPARRRRRAPAGLLLRAPAEHARDGHDRGRAGALRRRGRSRRRFLNAALLAALAPLFAPPFAPAQTPDELAELVRERMTVVRDRRLSLDEKRAAMDALLELGLEGPRQLASRIERDARALRKEDAKRAAALLDGFDRAARRLVAARLDRETEREIEAARALLRRHARDGALAKETIVAECDPARARLEELLEVAPWQVADADPEWAAERAALLEGLADERLLVGYFERCVAALERQPGGEGVAKRLERPEDPAGEEARLEAELQERARLATPMPDSDRRVLLENREVAAGCEPPLDPEEWAGIEDLNRLRVVLGLPALRLDPKLCLAARGHSQDMLTLGFFAHESPVEGKRTPSDRAARAGTSGGAENIAAGQRTGAGANQAWWHSPGHHRNMLGGHSRVGLGRAETLWTQLFGG